MNKQELVTNLVAATQISKKATEDLVGALGEVAYAALAAGEDVTLPGIGKLSVTLRKARIGRNPKTGEEVRIAAKNAIRFSTAKVMKEAINAPARKAKKK